MRPVEHVETSVLSFLAARLSHQSPVIAAHQRVTGDRWLGASTQFQLAAPDAVPREAVAGDLSQTFNS